MENRTLSLLPPGNVHLGWGHIRKSELHIAGSAVEQTSGRDRKTGNTPVGRVRKASGGLLLGNGRLPFQRRPSGTEDAGWEADRLGCRGRVGPSVTQVRGAQTPSPGGSGGLPSAVPATEGRGRGSLSEIDHLRDC